MVRLLRVTFNGGLVTAVACVLCDVRVRVFLLHLINSGHQSIYLHLGIDGHTHMEGKTHTSEVFFFFFLYPPSAVVLAFIILFYGKNW